MKKCFPVFTWWFFFSLFFCYGDFLLVSKKRRTLAAVTELAGYSQPLLIVYPARLLVCCLHVALSALPLLCRRSKHVAAWGRAFQNTRSVNFCHFFFFFFTVWIMKSQ